MEQKPEPEKENKTQGKVMKTYAEDMADVIENDQSGLVKKIIHEQEMRELEKKNVSPVSQINKVYIFLSFIFLTGALLTFVFLLVREERSSVIVEPQFIPLFFNDKSVFLEVSDLPKEKIIESVLTEVKNTSVKSGGIESIYITKNKQIMGLRSFLGLMKSNLVLPDATLVNENFMTGVFKGDENGFFLLLKMRSFQDIFDNLKKWESKMFYDMHAFFGFPINTSTNYLLTKNFEDGIIKNKNARILYDQDGKIVMMYVFVDENSLAIANKIEVINELVTRLSSSQIKK